MLLGINLNKLIESIHKINIRILALFLCMVFSSQSMSNELYNDCQLLREKKLFNESVLCYKKINLNDVEIIKEIGLTYFHQADYYRQASDRLNKKKVSYFLRQAIVWYRRAAIKNDAQSEFLLGLIYGKLLPLDERDIKKSIYFLTKASEKGYVPAQLELGVYYYDLGMKTKNKLYFIKSMSYFKKANTDEARKWIQTITLEYGIL